jgi:hypothetical protein
MGVNFIPAAISLGHKTPGQGPCHLVGSSLPIAGVLNPACLLALGNRACEFQHHPYFPSWEHILIFGAKLLWTNRTGCHTLRMSRNSKFSCTTCTSTIRATRSQGEVPFTHTSLALLYQSDTAELFLSILHSRCIFSTSRAHPAATSSPLLTYSMRLS